MSSQSKSQAVKDAIRALCHIMNASDFISPISCEYVRQGKFNKEEAIAPLSRFMYELIDQQKRTSVDEVPLEEIQKFVHRQNPFAFRTLDSVSELGSRDILLQIGWLLASSNLVNKQVKCILDSTSTLSPSNYLYATDKSDNLKGDPRHGTGLLHCGLLDLSETSLGQSAAVAGRLKYLVWMMGRLRLTLKSLLSEQQEICRLMHRVHYSTQGVNTLPPNLNHLSTCEAFIIRYPKLLKQYLADLEKEAATLQACLSWRQLEPVFWQWMVSVYEAKLSSNAEHNGDAPPEGNRAGSCRGHLIDSWSASRFSHLCDLQNSLEGMLHGLDAELASRDAHQILEQIYSCADTAKRKADVENSIAAKLAFKVEERSKSGQWNIPFHSVQFSFMPESTKHRQKQIETPQKNLVDIKSEILQLTDRIRMLQEELKELGSKQQKILFSSSDYLDNIVCIPPMSERGNDL